MGARPVNAIEIDATTRVQKLFPHTWQVSARVTDAQLAKMLRAMGRADLIPVLLEPEPELLDL